MTAIDFDAINRVALNRFESLLEQFLPDGKRCNFEYVARNPRRHDRNVGSFSININTGVWKDFADGDDAAGSDPVSLWAYIFNANQADAARILAGHLGVPELAGANDNPKPAAAVEQDWKPILPVPSDAGSPPDVKWSKVKTPDGDKWEKYPIVARWAYHDADGNVLGYAARVKMPDGTKDVVPQTFCTAPDGSRKWKVKSLPKPRPLYGLHRLAARPDAPVVMFEGEKTADAGAVLIERCVSTTWAGGSDAVQYVDIEPLRGRSVALWPDNDKAGFKAMLAMAQRLNGVAGKVVIVRPPEWADEGWDVADDAPDDWSASSHLKHNSVAPDDFRASLLAANDNTGTGSAIEAEPLAPANVANDDFENEEDTTVRGSSPYNYFTILGYNREEFFIFQHEKRQLMVINSGAFSSNKFIELAPFEVWCIAFPAKGGFDKSAAFNDLVRKAHSMPVFNPARIRGRGAWIDSNRHLFHFGNHMLIDGKKATIGRFASRYIYQAEVPFEIDLSVPPLTADEGGKLLMLASKFRWTMPASAALLTGWTAIAPLCGAMRWRPHIWLTGGAGCGKTTVLKAFVHQLTGWCDVFAQGNSTEAGIRQTLGCDAVPVLFDESEQNNEREATRVQNILALIRQASTESEAKTLKGTATGNAMNFHIRSMFCLASIQVGIQQQADAERMTVLSLRTKPEKGSPEEAQSRKDWEDLKEDLYLLERDETLPARLFKRMVQRLPMLMQSIEVFVVAAARHFGNQREGDQYGTLLAGCWCLVSDELPTQEDAAAMIAEFDWNDYAIGAKVDDATRAFNALLEARIRTPHGSEYSVFELCDRIASIQGVRRKNGEEAPVCQLELKDAQATLQRYGMKVSKNGKLMLSNSSDGLVRLMAGTPFQADFRGLVSRVQGVESRGEVVWINGSSCRCMAIPLTLIV